MIQLKRVYEKPSRKDGVRILVDRLWPRGLTKERAAVHLWLKDVAPSSDSEVPDAAVLAIRRGEFDRARSLLGELVAKAEVGRANEFLARGDLRSAMSELDRAVATAHSAEASLAETEASLRELEEGTRAEQLKQARQALEAYVDDPADSSLMRFCATYLHQVQGDAKPAAAATGDA
mgnify:CR=1 FL=1